MDSFDDIKTLVELEVCSLHHQHPIVERFNGTVRITCCCTDFQMKCYGLMVKFLKTMRQRGLAVVWKKPIE